LTSDGRDPSAERVARNDATFREANERIEETARELQIDRVPFICECAEESCAAVIQLELREYEAIRANPTHFLNVPGHEASAGPYGRVVEEHDGYVVVEKLGVAAEIVRELDERTSAESEQQTR
jgi:hypothetical protein